MTDLSQYPALVLNADYRPLSSLPLSTWGWKDALTAVYFGRVDVRATYDRTVRSAGGIEIELPSVVVLKTYLKPKKRVAVSRWNVFLRDGFRCSYCLTPGATHELTFDHVHPRSKGGSSEFENLATACVPCNTRKANRTPSEAGMPLLQKAYHPTQSDLYTRGMEVEVRGDIHKTWLDYVYWKEPLER